jgi:hypothetical protein
METEADEPLNPFAPPPGPRGWMSQERWALVGLVVVAFVIVQPGFAVADWPTQRLRGKMYGATVALWLQTLTVPLWAIWAFVQVSSYARPARGVLNEAVRKLVLVQVALLLGAALRFGLAAPPGTWSRMEAFVCQYGLVTEGGPDLDGRFPDVDVLELRCTGDSAATSVNGTLAIQPDSVAWRTFLNGAPYPDSPHPWRGHWMGVNAPLEWPLSGGGSVLVFPTTERAMEWQPDAYEHAFPPTVRDLRSVREWVPVGILRNLAMVIYWAVAPSGLSLFLILVICAGVGLSQRRWRANS